MQTRSSAPFFASWFLLSLTATVPAQGPGTQSRIQVLVYNFAGVPAETMALAESRAATIYRHAGIEMDWLDCPLTSEEAARYPQCLLSAAPDRMALRVVAGHMGAQFGLARDAFGAASVPAVHGFGVVALVCAECSARLAHGDQAMDAAILGHVMAHELGHLLLGTTGHTARGLMHAAWRGKELQRVAQGSLLFTSDEAAKMRRNAATRLASASPAEIAAH